MSGVTLYSALFDDFRPLKSWYPEFTRVVVKPNDKLEAPGILIIWGGSDIHPMLYNRPNMKSYVGEAPSIRDQAEAKLFAQAQKKGLFILGVCRGAQLACAMSGGILVQDVSGHQYSHRVTTSDGETMMTSSIHHQMMYPWKVPHELLAWSTSPRSSEYVGLTPEELAEWPKKSFPDFPNEVKVVEPEVVWFPDTNCLAVQGHPEMMDPKCQFNQYVKRLIDVRYPTA